GPHSRLRRQQSGGVAVPVPTHCVSELRVSSIKFGSFWSAPTARAARRYRSCSKCQRNYFLEPNVLHRGNSVRSSVLSTRSTTLNVGLGTRVLLHRYPLCADSGRWPPRQAPCWGAGPARFSFHVRV